MTQWFPGATVTIGGVSRTSITVNAVSITYGRTSFWEQPRASYATIEILNTTGSTTHYDIGASVVVTIEKSNGITPVTIFTGKIASTTNTVQANGAIGTAVITTISAYGPLTELAKATIPAQTLPKEFDDVRMNSILTQAGVPIDVVDTPGIYEFQSKAINATDGYTLASEYAKQAYGYIYETTSGTIGYANEAHRLVDSVANGYMAISPNDLLWAGIGSRSILENLLNYLTLTYRAGQVTSSNATSISTYGLASGKIDTQLHDLTDAQIQADRYVGMLSRPQTSLSSIVIPLDSNEILDADRDELLSIYMGKPISITGLPAGIYDGTYEGFVEGWNFNITRTQARLSLTTSEKSLSIVPSRWQDLNPLLAWDDLPTALEWFNYP